MIPARISVRTSVPCSESLNCFSNPVSYTHLDSLLEKEGMYISPGTSVNMIDRERLWNVTPVAKVGDLVSGGMVLATIQETPLLVLSLIHI